MRRFASFLISFITAFAFSSCATTNVQKIGTIDTREKTIAVMQGGGELSNAIKAGLRTEGWRVIAISGMKISPGDGLGFSGTRGHLARYSMQIEGHQFDYDLLTLKPIYSCSGSVADTKTGEEVMTFSAKDTAKNITKKVLEALR